MKQLLRTTSLACCLALMTGCEIDDLSDDNYHYDFNLGSQGWQVGYSDYPADYENIEIYQLQHGIRPLPQGFSGQGLMISGHNRSDDLFMFMKRKISGLQPSSRYTAKLKLNLLSNAGVGCMGIGGSPGESVYLKFGYADIEPKQVGYYLNVPKGNQAENGSQAKVIGNLATEGANCEATLYKDKTIETSSVQTLNFTSDANGTIWLFIGTDSGFEGLTTLYYRTVEIQLKAG